jgi:hypothetical protein
LFKEGGKGLRKAIYELISKYGRKKLYYMSGNMA